MILYGVHEILRRRARVRARYDRARARDRRRVGVRRTRYVRVPAAPARGFRRHTRYGASSCTGARYCNRFVDWGTSSLEYDSEQTVTLSWGVDLARAELQTTIRRQCTPGGCAAFGDASGG